MTNKRDSGREPIGPAHAQLGKMIKDVRTRQGKRMRDVQSCSLGYLSELENGRVSPSRTIVETLVRELGGDINHFRGVMVSVEREHETVKRRMKAVRDGVSPADLGAVYDPHIPLDRPVFEVIDDDLGTAEIVDPKVVNPQTLNFKGPFITEEIYEEHYVSSDRIVYMSRYNRLIRATEPGLTTFPWGFGETPAESILVSKFQLGVQSSPGLRIAKVAQIGRNAYAVDFELPHPLEVGERYQLSFFKKIDAVGYCDHFIGGSSAVELKKCRIAVHFEPGFEPARVWFFENLTPYSPPGIYSESHALRRRTTGQYEKEFNSLTPGLMLGIAWEYDD